MVEAVFCTLKFKDLLSVIKKLNIEGELDIQ